MRKTKIICTLGPATDGILPEMIKAGMNVARMNFSHGSHEEHKARMDAVKAARKELGMPVGIMLDTKGPEIRTKTYKDGKIEIVEGQEFTLTTRDIEGDNTIVSITYEGLPNDVQPGTRILIDDGLVAFEVLKIVDGTDIVCKALNGGPLSNRKSINVPGIKLNMKFISDKDREDIEFSLRTGRPRHQGHPQGARQGRRRDHLQDREHGRRKQHPGDPRRGERRHGRPRRPGR